MLVVETTAASLNKNLDWITMKSTILASLAIVTLLTACSPNPGLGPAPSAGATTAAVTSRPELTPENLTDASWKNGILIQQNGLNGFFVTGDSVKMAPVKGDRLTFAQSGERIVTDVVVNDKYINIYVDKPLDPIGDGFPHKVK